MRQLRPQIESLCTEASLRRQQAFLARYRTIVNTACDTPAGNETTLPFTSAEAPSTFKLPA